MCVNLQGDIRKFRDMVISYPLIHQSNEPSNMESKQQQKNLMIEPEQVVQSTWAEQLFEINEYDLPL